MYNSSFGKFSPEDKSRISELSEVLLTHPDSAPSSDSGANSTADVGVCDGNGLNEIVQSDIAGGNEDADVVLDGGRHVVGVGDIASQGVGGAAAVPAVGADCHA